MPYFTPSPDLTLFYTLHGNPSNPPFLLIHGWTCDSTDWSFTIPSLLASHHIIALDLRGHGHSTAPPSATFTIPDFCADAVALLRHLDIATDVLVMGHSMGGIVASCLTGLYPDIFSGLVVIDPPYWRTEAFWCAMLPKWDVLQDGLEFVTEAFGDQLPPVEKMQPWMFTWYGIRMAAMEEGVVGGALKGVFGQGGLGQEERHAEVVRARKCRRLAVYMAVENVEKERGLGVGEGDEVVHFGGHGHWLHHVGAEEFNEILGTWLKKLQAN
ncbi:Alpha/Beta hydrolase protein [Phaeosphaeria sp. MPI-PUGE-AT-0046c]|nr:Alpha/Beta hydrolase protein [Phaeosphaeria sp. MPI-PUGE-AT-0046c]